MIVNQVEKSNTKQEEDSPRKKKRWTKGKNDFFHSDLLQKKNVFDFTFFFVQDDTPKETTK